LADLFSLSGDLGTTPAAGTPSGAFQLIATLDESATLAHKHEDDLDLTVDTPVVVSFGGVTNAHVVMLHATGGKVKATLTSADGTSQAVPVEPLLILMNRTVPVTAISLTRVATVATSVTVFLGERA
jgi:hypothetical protein